MQGLRSITWLIGGLLFAALVPALPASAAAKVSVSVAPESGTSGEIFTYTVTVSGDEPSALGAPQFKDDEHFAIVSQGSAQKLSFVNGEKQAEISYTFALKAKSDLPPARYPVPAGRFVSSTQQYWLKRPEITIVPDTSPGNKPGTTAVLGGIDLVQTVDKLNPFVGEQVVYRVDVAVHRPILSAELAASPFDGFLQETFGKGRETVKVVGNQQSKFYNQREALFPTTPGPLQLPPRVLSVKLQVRNDVQPRPPSMLDELWGGFFDLNAYTTVIKKLSSKPVAMIVRPLPAPPRSGLTYVPVGTVALHAEFDRSVLKEGESASLRLSLEGNANLRPFELPQPAGPDLDAFRFYADKPSLDAKVEPDSIRFKKDFSIAVVPQKAGKLRTPVYEIVTFDPDAAAYKILRTPEVELTVEPDPSAKALVVSGALTRPEADRRRPEISMLAEDLLPQHIGKTSLAGRSVWPRWFVLVVLLGFPTVTAAFRLYLAARRRLEQDPVLYARLNAERLALERLEHTASLSGATGYQELELTLRRFLGDRYGTQGAALTTEEAVALAEEKIKDTALAFNVASQLKTLERMRYGGAAAPDGAVDASRIAEVRTLVQKVARQRS